MNKSVKENLRSFALEVRRSLSEEEVNGMSDKIIETLLKMPALKNSHTIMVYLSFNNEVDTFKLIDILKKQGKKVVVPFCEKEEIKIIPSELNDINTDLDKNPYGFLEPKKEKLKVVDIKEIDLVIVPGLVFDKKGNRVGFGGGYYDRFLKNKLEKTITIGVCYDFQIKDVVPVDKFDIPLDFILTNKRIIVR